MFEHLFDVEWRSRPDAETVVAPEGREGAHIGNGDGVVAGPKVNGTVRFSFYTADCPYDPGFMQASSLSWADIRDHVCRINPGGVIETDDGAAIQFDVKGFGLRLERHAPSWSLTEFNAETGIARYSAHARIPTD